MPQKLTQNTQRNVTWQTSSEYRRLTVLSSRTLNYFSFVRKIQIPEIFVSPLYVHKIATMNMLFYFQYINKKLFQ